MFVLLAASILAVVAGLRAASAVRARADGPPPPGRSATWYATYGEAALRAGRPDRALAAARFETRADPGAADAWARRAHAATRVAGGPDREALRALTRAMDLSPYPPAEQMTWRVAYAEAYWSAIPDALGMRMLGQIDALAAMNTAWDARIAWCAGSRVEAVAAAACATTPGVEQGTWLPDGPAAP